jgi:hypothetical protein
VTQGPEHEGYRPLECVQVQGDVMYVPATWNHLTINIGMKGWSDSHGVMSSIGGSKGGGEGSDRKGMEWNGMQGVNSIVRILTGDYR